MRGESSLRKSRSLNSSHENSNKLQFHADDTVPRPHNFTRPGLKRHKSLADLARDRKLHHIRSPLGENNLHRYYTTTQLDDPESSEQYDVVEYGHYDSDDQEPGFSRRSSHLPKDKDSRAVEYIMPESIRHVRSNVLESPHFLYRIGSQVFFNAGRDTSISHGHEIPEGAIRHDDTHRVSDVGQSFTFQSNDSDSDSDSGSEYQLNESRTTKWLDFIITDVLGFDATPESTTGKRALRERKTGIYDPGLLLGIVAGFT